MNRTHHKGVIEVIGRKPTIEREPCEKARAGIEAVHNADAGMVLVPRTATREMRQQALQYMKGREVSELSLTGAYAAMLTAHERAAALEELASIDNAEIAGARDE